VKYLRELLGFTCKIVFYFIKLLFVDIIFITINDLLVLVSTCIGHLQVIVRSNENFGSYINYLATVGDVMCVLDSLPFQRVFFSFDFLVWCNYCVKIGFLVMAT
jgi:hypothetical protein